MWTWVPATIRALGAIAERIALISEKKEQARIKNASQKIKVFKEAREAGFLPDIVETVERRSTAIPENKKSANSIKKLEPSNDGNNGNGPQT